MVNVLRRVRIAGLGTYVPDHVLSNADLEKMVDTTNEWIVQRTGILQRHIVEPGVGTSELAVPAAQAAMTDAGVTANEIGFIVVATTTPDMMFPSTACLVQSRLGAGRAWGFDLGAACSGFTYALSVGWSMVATGRTEHALVIGADVMSSIIDYTDRATCILFGDGAGAVVLSPAGPDEPAIIDFMHEITGEGGEALQMPAGGSRRPATHETVTERLHFVKQDGQAVFKFAVKKSQDMALRMLDRNGLKGDDLDLYVSHQANRRIIEATADRLGLSHDKVVINLDKYGNTTAATIPLALGDARTAGRLRRGNLVLLGSVGAGFTAGSVLLRWSL